MTWFTGTLVFVVIWFLVLFVVLPFGVRTPEEAGVEPEPGQALSAPVEPRLLLKFALTTLIALLLWGGFYWLQGSGLISLRDLRP